MSLLKSSHSEGYLTSGVESQTAKLPSISFLGAAVACMALSAVLKSRERNNLALFIGQWPAPLLLMGLYNKLVKQHGSD
ncbi:MAG TPA: hypothetical protein VEB21_19145 [Terriglobales bacterium]|nr:hypothetical protein [Terriglobales bacterium]